MKIVFVISGLSAGGAQRSLVTVCQKLAEVPSNNIFVATWVKTEDKYTISSNTHLINLCRPIPVRNSKLEYLISIWRLRQSLMKIKPDCVIAVQCNMFPRVLMATLFNKAKLLVWEHTSMSRKMDQEGTIARKFLYKLADGVIVLTNKDAKFVKGRYKRVFVMPNPLPFPVVNNECKRSNLVIAIGRLDVWNIKGFDRLITIWSKVNESNPSWKLYIVGEGNVDSTKYLKDEIARYGLENSVVLTGYRNDMPVLLQKAKIFVLTSRVEGFPMSLIEAMSQGCVGVSFSVGQAIEDIINNGEDGIIVKDGDCDAFSESLIKLMSDESKIQKMSATGRTNIKRFEDSVIIDKWNKMLKEVLYE